MQFPAAQRRIDAVASSFRTIQNQLASAAERGAEPSTKNSGVPSLERPILTPCRIFSGMISVPVWSEPASACLLSAAFITESITAFGKESAFNANTLGPPSSQYVVWFCTFCARHGGRPHISRSTQLIETLVLDFMTDRDAPGLCESSKEHAPSNPFYSLDSDNMGGLIAYLRYHLCSVVQIIPGVVDRGCESI